MYREGKGRETETAEDPRILSQRTERLANNKQILASVTRGIGTPSHKAPMGVTSDRGAPQMEGGTDVGGRRRRVRDPTLTLKSRPPDTQGGALEVSGSDSGESGRGREDRLKGKKEGGGQHSCTRSGIEGIRAVLYTVMFN